MDRRMIIKAGAATLGATLLPRAVAGQAVPPVTPLPPVPPLPPAGADGWRSLLNRRDLSGWYSMLQKSGKGVAEAKKMVMMEQEMLHVMGNEVNDELYEPGYLATVQDFENVHIRLEYKWGMKTFFPRTVSKRDNGLLYGLVGEDTVWPTCVECQIEEGDVGDFFLVGGMQGIQTPHYGGLNGEGLNPLTGLPVPGSAQYRALHQPPVRHLPPGVIPPQLPPAPTVPTGGRFIKDGDFEKLNDWNVVEVIWQGDRATHIVNGRAVNSVTHLQQPDLQNPGQYIPLTRGKIAIEIEYAEVWFRRIEVRSLT